MDEQKKNLLNALKVAGEHVTEELPELSLGMLLIATKTVLDAQQKQIAELVSRVQQLEGRAHE